MSQHVKYAGWTTTVRFVQRKTKHKSRATCSAISLNYADTKDMIRIKNILPHLRMNPHITNKI